MNYVLSIVMLVAVCDNAFSQFSGEPIDLRAIVHITAGNGGKGTGFIVATQGGESEVWTNGHVAGKAGSTVTVTQAWGTSHSVSTQGTVIESSVEGDYDRAKILTRTAFDCIPLVPYLGGDRGGDWHHGGYPKGGTFWLAAIRNEGHAFGEVTSFTPASISGQSGSPVIKKGKVVGVTTFRFISNGRAMGGFVPISQFTDLSESRRVSATPLLAGWERLD